MMSNESEKAWNRNEGGPGLRRGCLAHGLTLAPQRKRGSGRAAQARRRPPGTAARGPPVRRPHRQGWRRGGAARAAARAAHRHRAMRARGTRRGGRAPPRAAAMRKSDDACVHAHKMRSTVHVNVRRVDRTSTAPKGVATGRRPMGARAPAYMNRRGRPPHWAPCGRGVCAASRPPRLRGTRPQAPPPGAPPICAAARRLLRYCCLIDAAWCGGGGRSISWAAAAAAGAAREQY
ncbi:MAG: hypothetical protein J3K34DRAFT_416553 [Monoraphidium minutum]|nr:MAG: hypothetical protein J3K34DRAFT_416553 [Monoraphidium minutum]